MSQQQFDRLTAALGSGAGRRQTITGLLAGTATFLGQGKSTIAKESRKKGCKHCADCCPQRGCCSCRSDPQSPTATKCDLITAASLGEFFDACEAFCSPDEILTANFQIADRVNFCAPDNTCTLVLCPLPL